jgi:hypothetical protein
MRSVILSVNDNPDYLYYAPICAWAWKHFEWEPKIFYYGDINEFTEFVLLACRAHGAEIIHIPKIEEFRSDTITQTSRLHGYFFGDDDMQILGDIDMIPLSDYWKPEEDKITCYGWDLTGKTQIPICYIAGPARLLKEVFSNNKNDIASEIQFDLNQVPGAKGQNFEDYWYSDQIIATEKLIQYGQEKIKFINRGTYPNGFAIGRVDRGRWTLPLDQYIDSHLMRNGYKDNLSFERNMELYNMIFKDKAHWVEGYKNEYKYRFENFFS